MSTDAFTRVIYRIITNGQESICTYDYSSVKPWNTDDFLSDLCSLRWHKPSANVRISSSTVSSIELILVERSIQHSIQFKT